MDDIHALKPLSEVDFPWGMVFTGGLILLALALLGGWMLRRWLKHRPQTLVESTPVVPEIPALEMALRELDELDVWMRRGDCRNFYFHLEVVLRHYLDQTKKHRTTTMTTTELEHWLTVVGDPIWQAEHLKPLLERSLWAKFAKKHYHSLKLEEDKNQIRQTLIADAKQPKQE